MLEFIFKLLTYLFFSYCCVSGIVFLLCVVLVFGSFNHFKNSVNLRDQSNINHLLFGFLASAITGIFWPLTLPGIIRKANEH